MSAMTAIRAPSLFLAFLMSLEITFPVRLVGIDAPEIKGQCQTKIDLAMKAKDLLNQKLRQAHVIQIRHTARDYFR